MSTPAPVAAQKEAGWLAICGYLAAVLAPILGIILAVPLLIRGEYRHCGGVLLTVVASFLIRMAVMAGAGY